ncbi:MAG TPA: hypothetical protein VGO59_05480 [Verrucomicrobiae bacterium]|jgi:hypothetical protein
MNGGEFVQQFESRAFPFDQWHHRAPVKLACIYLTRHGFEAASQKLRDGIRAYNAARHVPKGPAGGCHETLAMFWLRVIEMTMREYGPRAAADRLFYSAELFMSARARREFVEPDLARLPRAGS